MDTHTITVDLSDYLANTGPNLNLEDHSTWEAFHIDSDELATWALRRMAAAQGEKDRIRAQAQVEIDRIQAWALDAEQKPARDLAFFEAKLNDYRRQLEANDPKLPKTYRLPTGSLVARKNPDRVTVTDEAEFLAWAEVNAPDAVQRRPLVSAIKGTGYRNVVDPEEGPVGRVVDTGTGEPIPGVAAVKGEVRYEAKPASDLDGSPF